MSETDEQEFRDLHDEHVRCVMHVHLRGVAETRRDLVSWLKSNPGFTPKDPHDEGCPACAIYRDVRGVSGTLPRIPATLKHDAGAYGQCGYCRRYSDDPDILGLNHSKVCDCGKAYGYSGSFKAPTAESIWNGRKGTDVTTIEPGKLYRRKSDGAKLMALVQDLAQSKRGSYWEFYKYGRGGECGMLVGVYIDDLEPWREPRRFKIDAVACVPGEGRLPFICMNRTGGPCENCVEPVARKRFTVDLVEGEIEE